MIDRDSLRKRWRRRRIKRIVIRIIFVVFVLAGIGTGIFFGLKKLKIFDRNSFTPEELNTPPVKTLDPEIARKLSATQRPSATQIPSSVPKSSVTEKPSATERPPESIHTEKPEKQTVDESYFDDALFIGDSRTEGFGMYSELTKATFYTDKGLMVDTIFTLKPIKDNGSKISIPNALKKHKFGKVYIMLGVNELGWIYEDYFINKYTELLDVIKSTQPDAVIYVQSILPVSKEKSDADEIYNNKKIIKRNKLLKKMAADESVNYLEVNIALTDQEGALFKDASRDGVHLNQKYCRIWKEYLMAHTIDR